MTDQYPFRCRLCGVADASRGHVPMTLNRVAAAGGGYACIDKAACLDRAATQRPDSPPARPGCAWPKCPQFADAHRELADAKTDGGPNTGEAWHVCKAHETFGASIGMWAPVAAPTPTLEEALNNARRTLTLNLVLENRSVAVLVEEIERLQARIANMRELLTTAATASRAL